MILIGCNNEPYIADGRFYYENNFEIYSNDTLNVNDTIWLYFSYPPFLANEYYNVTLHENLNTCIFGDLLISDLSETETKSVIGIIHLSDLDLYFKIGAYFDKNRDMFHSVYNPKNNLYELYFGYIVENEGNYLIRAHADNYYEYLEFEIIDDSVFTINSKSYFYNSKFKNTEGGWFQYTVVE